MTTTPLDDPGAPAQSEERAEPTGDDLLVAADDPDDPTGPDGHSADEAERRLARPGGAGGAGDPSDPPWWRPLRRWEAAGHRFLPGVTFPVAVWALWRAVHFVMSYMQVGPVTNTLESAMNVAFNYDGERYYLILHQGYANPNVMMPNTAFFPMTSWIATPIWWITRSDAWTVHLVATFTAIAAFVTVWAVTKEWRNEMLARRAVLLLAIMPSSLFLWAFYSEGLFMALGAGSVIADRKGKHGLAALLMIPLAATRSVGIVLPLVMVLARVIRSARGDRLSLAALAAGPVGSAVLYVLVARGTRNFSLISPRGLVVAIPILAAAIILALRKRLDRWSIAYTAAGALGLAVVMVVLWKQVGDPLAFMKVQEDWGRELSYPWETIKQGFDNLYPKPETIMIPALVARNLDLWSLLLVGGPLFYAMAASAWSKKDGWPMEAWLIGWALIALPLCSSALASFNRFAMADWVIYPVFASFLDRIPGKLRWIPYLVFAVAGAVVTWRMIGRFSADRFVG